MIWSANMQQFYIDNPSRPYYIATTSNLPLNDTWPFNAHLFLLTNIAVGGTLGGTPGSSTPSPAIMTYDYMRQYQAAAIPPPMMGTPPSITVKAGATTGNSSTFTPTPTANTSYVYFSCSTNAPQASCAIQTSDTLNKYVVNSGAGTPETVTVTVTTTANSTASKFPHDSRLSHWMPALIAFPLLLMVIPSTGRMRRGSLYAPVLIAVLTLTEITALSCGGSGGGNNAPVTPSGKNGTPPGSYTVTVYAFTGSNVSNGANSNADAHVDIPMTIN
jgi:hypothetical protein